MVKTRLVILQYLCFAHYIVRDWNLPGHMAAQLNIYISQIPL